MQIAFAVLDFLTLFTGAFSALNLARAFGVPPRRMELPGGGAVEGGEWIGGARYAVASMVRPDLYNRGLVLLAGTFVAQAPKVIYQLLKVVGVAFVR